MAVSRRFKRSIGGKRSRRNLRRNTRKIGGKRSRRNYRKRGGADSCPDAEALQKRYDACREVSKNEGNPEQNYFDFIDRNYYHYKTCKDLHVAKAGARDACTDAKCARQKAEFESGTRGPVDPECVSAREQHDRNVEKANAARAKEVADRASAAAEESTYAKIARFFPSGMSAPAAARSAIRSGDIGAAVDTRQMTLLAGPRGGKRRRRNTRKIGGKRRR